LTGNQEDGKITFAPNDDKSELVTNVVNKKGSTLPSTGGIGTTIFYAAGIVVMAGAVFFVVRSRKHD
jgi:LPXTG-motif cell wall-anchored protein